MSLLFYKTSKWFIIKRYSKEKKNKSSQINKITIFSVIGAMLGIIFVKRNGGGVWLLAGTIFCVIVTLKITFMENEIYSYVPNTNKKLKK